jgi:hypothetical protein
MGLVAADCGTNWLRPWREFVEIGGEAARELGVTIPLAVDAGMRPVAISPAMRARQARDGLRWRDLIAASQIRS